MAVILAASQLTFLTGNWLGSRQFFKDYIPKIINNLDSNIAHDHDMISICLLKLCGESVCKPLDTIYKTCLDSVKFPSQWRKANVIQVHKKGDKQTIEYYRPASLLPICAKIFEQILCNNTKYYMSLIK